MMAMLVKISPLRISPVEPYLLHSTTLLGASYTHRLSSLASRTICVLLSEGKAEIKKNQHTGAKVGEGGR